MFEETGPYHDSEIPAAIVRVGENPFFPAIVKYLFPDADFRTFKEEFSKIKTIDEFQTKVMLKAIWSIVHKSCSEFTWEGFDQLDNDHRYMFIANHRDILLDAALLQIVLNANHIQTSEITFGSNLMQGDLVIDIGKMNKMFRIVRGGTVHDFYRNSMEVSSYMRYALLEKDESVWIAQRNGRTKDGDDWTESAVLKMFSISSPKPFVENLGELNITPVAISYEFEPCDFMKTQELYISKYQQYIKEPGEDLRSITQFKRQVHLAVTPTITKEELNECDKQEKNMKFSSLAATIDKRIHNHYKIWNNNYIAYDILNNTRQYSDRYTSNEKEAFVSYMENGLKGLRGEADELQNLFLKIYASPVREGQQTA